MSTSRPNADPLATAYSRRRLATIAAVGLAVLAGAFAFWPLDRAGPAAFELPGAAEAGREPLSLAAFDAPVWSIEIPAAPAPTPAPLPTPPPLRLQLLGIACDEVNGKRVLKAVLFDPDSNKLSIVGHGQAISGRTVTAIEETKVTLSDGDLTHTLALRRSP